MNIQRAAIALAISILIALLVYPNARAEENLPEYARYAVCLTGVDTRFDYESDPTFKGFAPDKSVVTNALPHWHFRDYLRDLKMSADEFAEKVIGNCIRADFYRVDGIDHQTHHYAFFPYTQGQNPIFLDIVSLEKAGEPIGEAATEYLNPSMDQEKQAQDGLRGVGQTNTEQGKKRGEE
jgi:hypothetical protein